MTLSEVTWAKQGPTVDSTQLTPSELSLKLVIGFKLPVKYSTYHTQADISTEKTLLRSRIGRLNRDFFRIRRCPHKIYRLRTE